MAIRSNNSKLTNAVASGNIPYVKDILGNKDMKFSRLCLYTTLLVAAQGGKKQLVQLLLNFGVCISGRSKIGSLALVAAAKGGNLDIVKLLKGAPVNGRDSCGQTALMTAVEKSCCSDLILYLLNDCKANVNLQNNDGKTALMLAVEQWDFETIQLLFTGCGNDNDYDCDEDIEDKKGQTALDLAKMNGSADLLNVFSDSRKKRMSPLSMAAGMNNLNLVQRLLDIYPSCIEGMPFGKTPLIAAMHGLESNQIVWTGKIRCSFELMDCLLEAGVDVNDIHSCERTPLMFAASVGSLRAVQMLLSHGASVNISVAVKQ
ncbi:hypothetical protein RRG08_036962 [Elysia crispata]|uniref:Uncharacterized protein n=1 Tax=Elysia crispata TaxID=231223 RepID=A0AAE0XTY1_9GAST|nr:hypothetical protein RRG08_036962 [Elysia crispata]